MDTSVSIMDELLRAYNDGTPRIFALMGPNGSGKSRQLVAIKNALEKTNIPCMFVPPDRNSPRSVSHEPHTGQRPSGSTFEELWASTVNVHLVAPMAGSRMTAPFQYAITNLIKHAILIEREAAANHSAELVAWSQHRTGPPPPPLSQGPVKAIESKLQQILNYRVEIAAKNHGARYEGIDISFHRGDLKFGLEGLSSGESQLLLISAFLLSRNADRFVFIIDEPELHFNEALAVSTWESFEACFPKSVFLYATHSPSFATRPSVDRPLIIGMNQKIEAVERQSPINPTIMSAIVGARIQVLRDAKHPIFCEDELHKAVISDLFESANFVPIMLHNCDSVLSAVKGEGAWKTLRSGGPKCCGVRDRDTLTTDEAVSLERRGVFCFPRYDMEALLLDPAIALWSLAQAGYTIPLRDYTSMLVQCAQERRKESLDLIAKRLLSGGKRRVNFDLKDDGTVNETSVNIEFFGENIRDLFLARAQKAEAAIESGDIDAILTVFRGKTLYASMANLMRSKATKIPFLDPLNRYNHIRAFEGFAEQLSKVEWLTSFRIKIEAYLSAAPAG